MCLTDQLMFWCELVDKLECYWCLRISDLWFWFINFNMIVGNCLRDFTPHVVRNILYKLLYWNYEMVIQTVSKWQVEPVMNGEIHMYWDDWSWRGGVSLVPGIFQIGGLFVYISFLRENSNKWRGVFPEVKRIKLLSN